jgi:N-acetylmuramic acid 6-phosphate etherase
MFKYIRELSPRLRLTSAASFLAAVWLLVGFQAFSLCQQETQVVPKAKASILELLRLNPSAESIDYVKNKTQFQLHTLLTEQRHPKTWDLSERIQKDCESGLRLLFSVDEDIVEKLEALSRKKETLEQASRAVEQALFSRQKIYIYGCGATGRLAKQMESTFWRPFWQKAKKKKRIWSKIKGHFGDSIENQLIGEMTGGDRALISSLEGFEDLQLIGRLQLEDRKIEKGDVVICVTEGGETSSVIGTILAALDEWGAAGPYEPEKSREKLYFIYNNPDDRLRPFDRSRRVLDEGGITKINLTTGPQAITGSTRMQATTIETFVVGNILQQALDSSLRKFLSKKEMAALGFKSEVRLEDKLREFSYILKQVRANLPAIAKFTKLEADTYQRGNFSTYFARKGLITVFIDSTERSPTFRLFPLDTVKEAKRKSWIQVWTPAANLQDAWQAFLGRPFRGLSSAFYRKPFEEEIDDPYLKKAALESLKNAGDDQQFLYDFSFADFNLKNRQPSPGDLGVAVLISPEEGELGRKHSDFRRFIDLFSEKGARLALILITDKSSKKISKIIRKIPEGGAGGENAVVVVNIESKNDPLGINQRIALKILLNAHSTGVMARLGKVIGNTMTNVSPSNLKLIGRATYLIQLHVNDVLSHPQWVKRYGILRPISYGEANAVLFDAIDYLQDKKKEAGQTAEVAFSIIRILESLRLGKGLIRSKTLEIVKETGLSQYLSNVTSQ